MIEEDFEDEEDMISVDDFSEEDDLEEDY